MTLNLLKYIAALSIRLTKLKPRAHEEHGAHEDQGPTKSRGPSKAGAHQNQGPTKSRGPSDLLGGGDVEAQRSSKSRGPAVG